MKKIKGGSAFKEQKEAIHALNQQGQLAAVIHGRAPAFEAVSLYLADKRSQLLGSLEKKVTRYGMIYIYKTDTAAKVDYT